MQTTALPLTAAQHAIWLGHQLDQKSPAYNVASSIEIEGEFDPCLLAQALRQAVNETEVLRARYPIPALGEDEVPWQTLLPEVAVHLPLIDLHTHSDPAAAARVWEAQDVAKRIDLIGGPMFHTALLRLAPQRHWWYFKTHHIALDGFGLSMLFKRVANCYTAIARGQALAASPFGSLSRLVEDELAWRDSAVCAASADFWQRRCRDADEVPSLAERSAQPGGNALQYAALLPSAGVRTLYAMAECCDTHWVAVLIAAFAAFIGRATGYRTIVLGIPFLNRLGTVAADVPCTTANVLPLRVVVRPHDTVGMLISRVANNLAEMREHQRYRAEDVRRDCKLVGAERRLTGPQINIDFFTDTLAFDVARGHARVVSAGPADDLSLLVQPNLADGGLRLLGLANPALYTDSELRKHVQRFLAFVPTFLEHPDKPVGQLDVCLPDELRSFFDWAHVASDGQPQDGETLVSRFETLATAAPDATALTLDGVSMSYSQLNARANQLAHLLSARMSCPGQPVVALLLARSILTVVAIIGVLKAGAAYVPLDPEAPAGRIAEIVADVEPSLLVADMANSNAALRAGVPIIVIDGKGASDHISAQPRHNPTSGPQSDNLAYIIYTSGSTGKPKGVCVTHRNVVRLFTSTHSWFDYRRSDVWTMCHSYVFDASVWEMWGALLHGGRLVIVPVSTTRSPKDLLMLLVAERVTVSGQIPSSFYRFIEAEADDPELGARLNLRYQCFGGEALDTARLLPWFERHPVDSPRLLNMYGITETTINTTYRFIRREDAEAGGSLIGKAYEDVGLMVLDDAMRPVPEGGYGEMYVSGAGLARGYLKRPDLDATRFVANPFGPPGSRMYRSGDVAVVLPGGELEYVGRADQQVKLRGYRIELGEIEAHLRAHPQISDAVASVRLDAGEDARLLAYVVPVGRTQALDAATVRDYLRERVPPYMVPNAVGVLEQLPLTSSGKVDRKALPEITPVGKASHEPARDVVDEGVLACWCRHLQIEVLGIDDNFFDVGGDSIKAIRVCRELDIPVLTLFEMPTVRASADYLRARPTDRMNLGPRLLHRFTAGSTLGRVNLICVPYAGGNAFAYRNLMNALSDRFACISVNLPGHDVLRPDEALWPIADVAAQAAVEILETVRGPIVIYGHCAGNAIAVALAREVEHRGADLRALVIGGMLLDADPVAIEGEVASRSGADIIGFLRSIGGFKEVLDDISLNAIAHMTKHDATETAAFFARETQARQLLRAPIHVVVGDADPLTPDYSTRYRDWSAFTQATRDGGSAAVSLSVLGGGGHYFVTDLPDALAAVLEHSYGPLGSAAKARSAHTLRKFYNPFDDTGGFFYLLENDNGQHSIWPAFMPQPSGWTSQFGPATRAACLTKVGADPAKHVPGVDGLDAPYWPDEYASAYRRKGYWTDATLGGMIREHALVAPDRVALVERDNRLTYAELDTKANRLADGLSKLGLATGDRVVVQLPNSIRFVELIFALFRLGAIPVFALPSDRANEITHILATSMATAYVIVDQARGFDYRNIAKEIRSCVQSLQHVIVAGDAHGFIAFDSLYGDPRALPERDASEAALITLSGGTTSLPKLILRRHQDYLYSIRASAEICGLNSESVYLCVLPAGHNFALSSPGFLGVLHAGGRVVMTGDPSPSNAFALIERERVTFTAVVPSLALAWLIAERRHDLSSLQFLQVGGAHLSADVARQLSDAFPCRLQQVYGMSEGLVCYTRPGDTIERILHTQGLPISADDEIRILDDSDQPVQPGTEGQLLVRGPYTVRGYVNAAEHNRRAFTADGFYRTGDLVRQESNGYLVVTGRIKDQVNRGGEKIAAEEIEGILLAHPDVRETAVVGMPDKYLGEIACAFVVSAQDSLPTPGALKAYVRSRGVADFKVPDLIRFVPSLPKTTLGKIDKKALRNRLEHQLPLLT